MAMRAFNYSYPTLCAITLLFSLLLLLLSAVSPSSVTHQQLRGSEFEDKSRLGSTPPSCHNKCNNCRPCTAVQVPTGPTLPSLESVWPAGSTRSHPLGSLDSSSPSPTAAAAAAGSNGYNDYKPLGWKCRCGDRFYDP